MPLMHSSTCSDIQRLADCLGEGLRSELFLTPKPGLVDLLDSGAHADLSLPLMLQSVTLVTAGYRQFADALREQASPRALVALGRAIEDQLRDRLGTNTHKGAIFLGGLLLCALPHACRNRISWSAAVAAVAQDILADHRTGNTHGARVRRQHRAGGILEEARRGLPTLFATALPTLAAARGSGFTEAESAFLVMARLMQKVDDTTTLHRGGPAGLARLRNDGRTLEKTLLQRRNPFPLLHRVNHEYRALHLTMGGVADLLAMTFALDRFQHRATAAEEAFRTGRAPARGEAG